MGLLFVFVKITLGIGSHLQAGHRPSHENSSSVLTGLAACFV